MTTLLNTINNTWGVPPTADYEKIAFRFRPIFQKIREKTEERENNRELLFEVVNWLKKEKFGAVRLPVEKGGLGASIVDLTELLTELAAADSNVTQSLRAHFSFTEMVLHADPSPVRDVWLERIANGDIIGNAWTETGPAKIGGFDTKVRKTKDGLRLSGTKYYSTGTIYADWILVLAADEDDNHVFAVVDKNGTGVEVVDDWNGFGQILTGTGTTHFHHTPLEQGKVLDKSFEANFLAGFFQLVHLATLSGIARAAVNDVAREVSNRTRNYSHSTAASSKEDAQVLQIVGRVHSLAYAVGAIAEKAAKSIQAAGEARFQGDEEKEQQINDQAEIEISTAQAIISRLTPEAATLIFDALGASATSIDKRLDRHWRNARTVASHNPLIYKERIVGDYIVNQTPPPYIWFTGEKNKK